jgi:glycosyltransferase involved in cell wall biosynthesis
MACGVPIISNNGPQVEWYCRHMDNAYLVDPTPTAVLNAVNELCSNSSLRQQLVNAGLKKSAEVTWESEMDRMHAYVQDTLAQDGSHKAIVNG